MDNEHINGGTFEIKGEGLTDEEVEQLRRQQELFNRRKAVQEAVHRLSELEEVHLIWSDAVQQPKPELHVHGPFTFLLNANHNALRGCQTCGTAWIGFMAGSVEHLVWHLVQEEEENEK